MNTSIQTFQFTNASAIRIIVLPDGSILFVASDVAKSLGYSNPPKAITDHCKKAKLLIDIDITIRSVQQNQQLKNLDPKTKLIPEADVYRLAMRSKLESAEKFQDWIVEDVLPSIRKTGFYQHPVQVPQAPKVKMITRKQFDQLSDMVNRVSNCCQYKGAASHAMFTSIRKQYGLNNTDQLPEANFEAAMSFLMELKVKAEAHMQYMIMLDKAFIRDTFKVDPLLIE